jgi:putative glutamine amidotransferase
MTDRPMIGITTRAILVRAGQKERPGDSVPRGYVRGVEESGGIPILLPTVDPSLAPRILDRIDGLILAGGEDVHPRLYGEEPVVEIDAVDERRDHFEIALVRAARERDLPTFGVCRGIQVMNVALGGTLYQDIPSATGSRTSHTQKSVEDCLWHRIEVERGSLLSRLVGEGEVSTNSFHHQALKSIGAGLRVVAKSLSDGLVEGVEDPSRRWFLGVQWHPEISFVQGDPPSRRLFEGIVGAAAGADR